MDLYIQIATFNIPKYILITFILKHNAHILKTNTFYQTPNFH